MNTPISQIPDLIKIIAKPFDPGNAVLIGDLEYLNNIHCRSTQKARGIAGRSSRIYRYLLEGITTFSQVQHGRGKNGFGLLLASNGRLQLSDIVRDSSGQIVKMFHRAGDDKNAEIKRAFTNDHLLPLDDQCRIGISRGKQDLEELYWMVVENNLLVQVAHEEQVKLNLAGYSSRGPKDDHSFGARLKSVGIIELNVFRPTLKGKWFVI